jgi:hypothetical protein
MKKYTGFAIAVLALVVAGALSAYGASRLWPAGSSSGDSSRVIARVMSVSGDTVTLYYGGHSVVSAFCENENLPVFSANVLEGNVSLVGEVKITNIISPDYAVGKLVVGDADLGNISSKPGGMCMEG